jgi:pantoate--beta-alanine ligase
MQTLTQTEDVRRQINDWRRAGETIAFVPTMGNLHEGHLQLLGRARCLGDRVVVSVFVNPMQFGAGEDFATYPRTLDEDRRNLEINNVDLLFAPDVEEIYPRDVADMTRVDVPHLSDILCGQFRPGHFAGVTTIVNKLFNIVTPDVAVFGQKDYQQLQIVRRMVADLALPVNIVGVATVREPDGLALSSRNQYLSLEQRQLAPVLYRTLCQVRDRIRTGDSDYAALESQAVASLTHQGFRVDYFAVRRRDDLGQPAGGDHALVLLVAAWLGKTRLIDNVEVSA